MSAKLAYDIGVRMALRDAGLFKVARDIHNDPNKLRNALLTGAAGMIPLPLTGTAVGSMLAPEGQRAAGALGPLIGGGLGSVGGGLLGSAFGPTGAGIGSLLGKGVGAGLGYTAAVD